MGKKKIWSTILVLEAVVCIVLSLLWKGEQNENAFKVLEIPFELLGNGLRWLSLSGAVGNVLAIILYVVVCLLPVGIVAYLMKNKKVKLEEILLLILSALLFWGIYIFINPVRIAKLPGMLVVESHYKFAIVATVYSLLILYIIVKVIRSLEQMKEQGLINVLQIMCKVVLMVLVMAICFIGVAGLVANVEQAIANNNNIIGTCVLLVFRFIVEQLPNVCIILLIVRLMNASEFAREGLISQEIVDYVKGIAKLCKKSLMLIMLNIMLLNLVQLLLTSFISISNYNVVLPVLETLFIVIIFILAKLVTESYKMKQDNDLFI